MVGGGLKFYNIRCALGVCVAMFSETTGAVCPSHNKYTRLPPTTFTLIVSPCSPLLRSTRHPIKVTAAATATARPSGALSRSIENAILLYCTYTHINTQPLWWFNRETTTFRPPSPCCIQCCCRFAPQNTYPFQRPSTNRHCRCLLFPLLIGTWPPVDIEYLPKPCTLLYCTRIWVLKDKLHQRMIHIISINYK